MKRQSLLPSVTHLGRSAALAVLLGTGLFLHACSTETAEVEAPAPTPQFEPAATPTQQINGESVAFEGNSTEDLEAYLGKTVAVTGQVAEIYGPGAFSLESDATLSPGKPVLVLVPNADSTAMPTAKGQYVQLLGDVRAFTPGALEEDYNMMLDPALRQTLQAQYNLQPVLISKEE